MFPKFLIQDKYGKYYKVPWFTLFALLPFSLLYEESALFWTFYYLAFLGAIFTRKVFSDRCVPVLAVVGVLVSIVHYYAVAQIDLLFFARVLLFMQLGFHLMAIERQTATVIYFINFVLILVAGALTYKFWFAIYIFFFLFLSGYFCLELQFLRFRQPIKPQNRWSYTGKLVGFLILSGYLFFLIFPRVKFDRFPSQIGISISGFNESVSFDDMTNILQSDKVVMRVKTKYPPAYYKGITLDYYDGTRFKNKTYFRHTGRKKYDQNGAMLIPTTFDKGFTGEERKYEFQVLPSKNKYLFIPDFSKSIDIDPPSFTVNRHGDLKKKQTLTKNLQYTVYTEALTKPNSYLTQWPAMSEVIKDRYLQLPEVSEPVKKLASVITKDATSYYEIVQAVLNSFERRNYTYSLKSQHPGNPLEDFLLRNKIGHCQFFAGAMVVLLRLNGVPARMVNGFTSGEYNEWGDHYTVRLKDAHSWVEVYAGNGIWIPKDPTPSAPANWYTLAGLKGLFGQFTKIEEYLDSKWQTYVLYYSRLDQFLMWTSLMNWWRKFPFLNTLFLFSLFILFLMGFKFYFKSFEFRTRYKNLNLKRLDKILEQWEVARPSTIGLLEHIESLQVHPDLKKLLLEIQDLIYYQSFSKNSVNKPVDSKIEKKVQTLIQTKRTLEKEQRSQSKKINLISLAKASKPLKT